MPGHHQTPTVLLAARAIFKAQRRAGNLTRTPSSALSRNPGWRNSDHFVDCSNFEQSLLKMMTRRKRWSNTAASDWPQGFKSGGPSLGRSPGAHKQRRPVHQDQIQIIGEI